MNTYDKHQLTARELQSEETPTNLEIVVFAAALLVGLLPCIAFFFSL